MLYVYKIQTNVVCACKTSVVTFRSDVGQGFLLQLLTRMEGQNMRNNAGSRSRDVCSLNRITVAKFYAKTIVYLYSFKQNYDI